MSVGTSGSTMNPKPFFSLNHLTVPLDIGSTERANHPDPDFCQNSKNLIQLSAWLEKAVIIWRSRKKRQEECNTIISSRIHLASSSRIALFSLCPIPAWWPLSWEANLIGQPCTMRRICFASSGSKVNQELFPHTGPLTC